MINYNLVYLVFLVFVAGGVFAVTTIDTDDRGSCNRSVTGGIAVRQPDSQSFIEKKFCILVWS